MSRQNIIVITSLDKINTNVIAVIATLLTVYQISMTLYKTVISLLRQQENTSVP